MKVLDATSVSTCKKRPSVHRLKHVPFHARKNWALANASAHICGHMSRHAF